MYLSTPTEVLQSLFDGRLHPTWMKTWRSMRDRDEGVGVVGETIGDEETRLNGIRGCG